MTPGWASVQLHPEQQRDDERLDPHIPPRGLLRTDMDSAETADRGRRCVAGHHERRNVYEPDMTNWPASMPVSNWASALANHATAAAGWSITAVPWPLPTVVSFITRVAVVSGSDGACEIGTPPLAPPLRNWRCRRSCRPA
jgi:hypothetical protein